MASRLNVLTLLLLGAPILCAQASCDPGTGQWGPWSQWTNCSRSCGSGVSTRTRDCLNEHCVGGRLQYRSCCVQECVDSVTADHDFVQQQCLAFPGLQADLAESTSCSIRCASSSEVGLVNAVDGTPCLQPETGRRGACLGRLCARLGCDGVVGSDRVEDKCLRCHAPMETDSSCTIVRGSATHSREASGNLSMVELPAGATSVEVTHHPLPNNGMLALSQSGQQPQMFNGADLDVGGVMFSYKVTDDGRTVVLTARGPLNQPITVQLVAVNGTTPTVDYEFYQLSDTSDEATPTHQPHTPHDTNGTGEYVWRNRECFGECPVTCGTGLQVSQPVCEDTTTNPPRPVDDRFCLNRGMERPALIVRKCNTTNCPPRWEVGEWRGCSSPQPCGGHHELRSVQCLTHTNEGESVASDRKCSHLTRPNSSRPCVCKAQWTVKKWSECRDNHQTRVVFCADVVTERPVSHTHCNHGDKPKEMRICSSAGECGWKPTKWGKCGSSCGVGTQTRRLRCKDALGNHKVHKSCCEGKDTPITERECFGATNCTVEWRTIPRGKYGGRCSETHYQSVEAVCGAYVDTEWVNFTSKACAHLPRPTTTITCTGDYCPEWRVSEFSQCSSTCGMAYHERNVTCVSRGVTVEAQVCEDCHGLVTSVQVCLTPPCPPMCVDSDPNKCKGLTTPCGTVHWNICCASCRNMT